MPAGTPTEGGKELFDSLKRQIDQINVWIRTRFGDSGWVEPTLENSWKQHGTAEPGYRTIGTEMILRGRFEGGASGSVAFTLPSGPTQQFYAPIVCGGEEAGAVIIEPSGTVTLLYVTQKLPSLDGIRFFTD